MEKMHDKPLDSQDYRTYNLTMIKIDRPIQLRNVTARYYWFTSPPAWRRACWVGWKNNSGP